MGHKATHFPSSLDQLGAVRKFVDGLCHDLPDKEKIILAIDEAFTNIVKHSHPTADVILEADLSEKEITFILKDQGKGFDPAEVRPPDFSGDKTSGFGLYIIEQVADRITYVPKATTGEYNELRIYRRLG